jgi:hypothetical protein
LAGHFTRVGDDWKISERLARMVEFRCLDLLEGGRQFAVSNDFVVWPEARGIVRPAPTGAPGQSTSSLPLPPGSIARIPTGNNAEARRGLDTIG